MANINRISSFPVWRYTLILKQRFGMYRVRSMAFVCIFLAGFFSPLAAVDPDADFGGDAGAVNTAAFPEPTQSRSAPLIANANHDEAFTPPRTGLPSMTYRGDEQFPDLIDRIIEVNTRFAFVSIALAAITTLLVLLLLLRLGGIRDSISRSVRDMGHTKDALRYLMDMDRQTAKQGARAASPPPQEAQGEKAEAGTAGHGAADAVLSHMTGEMEKLAKRLDDLSRAAGPANAEPANKKNKKDKQEEVQREVERRLAAMNIESVEPAVGEKFDPLFHDEVDSRPSGNDLDGTIFRVIQNGLVYNSRVALKARVVVNRA
jgi:hypothetical protein